MQTKSNNLSCLLKQMDGLRRILACCEFYLTRAALVTGKGVVCGAGVCVRVIEPVGRL